MKLRFLNLGNDFWFRIMFIPFVGFLIPYITRMVPEEYVHVYFISKAPSLYTMPVVFFIFESNRMLLTRIKTIVKFSLDGYTFLSIRRILFHLLITALMLLFFLHIWYSDILNINDYKDYLNRNFLIGLSFALFIVIIYEAGFFIDIIVKEMTKSHLLEIENVKSQTNLLKKQIAPHFMFNSLGTLMSLIELDKQKALIFLNKFSNSFRYVLTHSDDLTVEIKQELEFVDDYISLAKSNYGDKSIIYCVDIKKIVQKNHIPTLAIQMLIENALKHNQYSNRSPLSIHVFLNKNETHLCVKNNIQYKSTKFSTSLGLQSIIQRYKLLGDYEVEIDKSSKFFEVRIPLIKDLKLIK